MCKWLLISAPVLVCGNDNDKMFVLILKHPLDSDHVLTDNDPTLQFKYVFHPLSKNTVEKLCRPLVPIKSVIVLFFVFPKFLLLSVQHVGWWNSDRILFCGNEGKCQSIKEFLLHLPNKHNKGKMSLSEIVPHFCPWKYIEGTSCLLLHINIFKFSVFKYSRLKNVFTHCLLISQGQRKAEELNPLVDSVLLEVRCTDLFSQKWIYF